MNNVNYRVLKSNIIKACKQVKRECMDFKVNYERLTELVSDLGLTPICMGLDADRVDPKYIPFLSEYFEKSRLSWITDTKYFTIITFVNTEAIDEKAQDLLNGIAEASKNPNDKGDIVGIDKANACATLIAEYPCYFATIVSYQNNDPRLAGRASYEIVCRANKVVIKGSNYQYNPEDFS